MTKSYINGISCISAQPTASEKKSFLEDLIAHDSVVFKAFNPDYKKFIKPAAMRRMSQSVKMGVAASSMALNDAEIEKPDAIITGTGRGCRQDSESFLEDILQKKEKFLTPIKFIQSTHNTVGGQIALGLDCNAYNFTYVQGAASFESALLDAQLFVAENPSGKNVLIGGLDELAKNSIKLHTMNKHLKQEKILPDMNLLRSKTAGTTASEGAAFFVLSAKKTENTYAKLVDVGVYSKADEKEMETHIQNFLASNGLKLSDLGVVVLGNNGDVHFDFYYEVLQKKLFEETPQLYYKHLSGEHNTASSFGMWMGAKILKSQTVPETVRLNKKPLRLPIKNVLLYNQYRGRDHSLILLEAC